MTAGVTAVLDGPSPLTAALDAAGDEGDGGDGAGRARAGSRAAVTEHRPVRRLLAALAEPPPARAAP